MFTTTVTVKNENSEIANSEEFDLFYIGCITDDIKNELDYLRFDMILDGKCSNKMYHGWDSITKSYRYMFYHDTAENMRDMNEAYTTNWAAIKLQEIFTDLGWQFDVNHGGTVVDTRDANKINEINYASLNMVRPERRQEVFDSLEENNG